MSAKVLFPKFIKATGPCIMEIEGQVDAAVASHEVISAVVAKEKALRGSTVVADGHIGLLLVLLDSEVSISESRLDSVDVGVTLLCVSDLDA